MKKKAKKKVATKKPLKVVIDRKRWLRGHISLMRNKTGSMCCLGFVSRAMGCPVDVFTGFGSPEEIANRSHEAAEKLAAQGLVVKSKSYGYGIWQDSDVCVEMVNVNDDNLAIAAMTANEREQKLKDLAKRLNIDMRFKG